MSRRGKRPRGPEATGEPRLSRGDAEVERQMGRLSRRSFLWAAAAVTSAYTGWHWLVTRRADNGALWPMRRMLEVNEQLARDYFRPTRLAPTYPRSMAAPSPRVNGDLGLSEDFDPVAWRLHVTGVAAVPKSTSGRSGVETGTDTADSGEREITLSLADIRALPRVEMVTELHCIEGWTEIIHWGGARFADFIARYPPGTLSGDPPDVKQRPDDLPEFLSLETPDGEYFVGIDMASALHPQTLLCYEINGQPLSLDHGAPLRLVIPVRYGVKNIKRIGTIRFTSQRPDDYWYREGYDWYAGL